MWESRLPGDTVHGLFVDWRHHEADGRHCGLAAGVIENPPLEGLGVVEECTLIAFVDSDLEERKQKKKVSTRKSEATASVWLPAVSHLLLLEVADGLDGQLAFDWRGGVARFKLDDGPGSFVQARHHRLKFIQLFSLLLSFADKRRVNVTSRRRSLRPSEWP